jgi:hypothetical protein
MNEREARKAMIGLWLQKAGEALASAELKLSTGQVDTKWNSFYPDAA